jgi:hypothetical protein
MTLFRATLAVALMFLGTTLAWTPAVHAESSTVCTVTEVARLAPGMSLAPSAGTVGTGGQTAPMNCVGDIHGQRVTDPGTWGIEHAYGPGPLGGATCAQSSGSGRYFYTIPTAGGVVHVEGALSYTAMGPGGTATGDAGTSHFTARFQFRPMAGDCVTRPLTAATVTIVLTQEG